MSPTPPLADQAARDDAATRLTSSAFIEAGAGTGKSTTLVARIVETVRSQRAGIGQIAAITFTDRAGADLRHRLRDGLVTALAEDPDAVVIRSALEHLAAAVVGTIHSFAQQILRTHALAAGLPLGFTVATGTQMSDDRRDRARAIVEQWEQHLDPVILHTLDAYGLGALDLMPLAEQIDDSALRLSDAAFAQEPTAVADICARVADGLAADVQAAREACTDPADRLYALVMAQLPDLIEVLRRADPEELADAAALIPEKSSTRHPAFSLGNVGSGKNWSDGTPKEWRDRIKAWEPDVRSALRAPLEHAVRGALAQGRTVSLAAREARAREGVVDFDGLLSRTRDLLVSDPDVRAQVHASFTVLMVDEFQDTDPVQWDIIRLVTSAPDDPAAVPEPGRLIVVGDPKQAIYSFRGADIDTYTRALQEFTGVGTLGASYRLTTNFRSVAGILDWVNIVFAAGMDQASHQVPYAALDVRHRPHHPAPGPAVTVIRDPSPALPDADEGDAPGANAPKIRSTDLEPVLVAQEIARAVRDRWQVTEPTPGGGRDYARRARFSDVAVLYPARTGVPALLDAFDDAGVPYRSADARLVFSRPCVRGLLAAMTVIDDPACELDLWVALKSPLFACRDDDLLRHRRAGGRWRVTAPDHPDGVVGDAMAALRALRFGTDAPQPVAIIDDLLARTGLMEALSFGPRGSFEADCLRMVRAHAQQWQDGGGIGLPDYLREVVDVQADSSRASLPEPDDRDDNAVRLMTVFGAKGLEFPIVALAGMSHLINSKAPSIGIVDRDRFEFRRSGHLRSAGFADWDVNERYPRDTAERMRVAYVACTRARDHLIVSVCGENGTISRPHSSILAPHVTRQDTDVTSLDSPRVIVPVAEESHPGHLPPDWASTIERLQHTARTPFIARPSGDATAALGLGPGHSGAVGDDPASEDSAASIELTSEQTALALRDGRPLGNAVHAALDAIVTIGRAVEPDQIIDICTGAAQDQGIADQAGDIVARVTHALASDLVQEALSTDRRWPELYLAAPVAAGGIRLVEGFADLVFESADGIVLVDYKTDRDLTEPTLQHYAGQLAAYAELLNRATGRQVSRTCILHASTTGARVIDL